MTRGWTYQEAFLSKVRFYFTEYRVRIEVEQSAFEENHDRNGIIRRGVEAIQVVGSTQPTKDIREIIYNYITEYSRHRMSFKLDYLNGFLGIFEAYHIQHLWGIPFIRNEWEALEPPDQLFMRVMNWCVGQGYQQEARLGFPTWSWVGWTGRIDNECCSSEVYTGTEFNGSVRVLYEIG